MSRQLTSGVLGRRKVKERYYLNFSGDTANNDNVTRIQVNGTALNILLNGAAVIEYEMEWYNTRGGSFDCLTRFHISGSTLGTYLTSRSTDRLRVGYRPFVTDNNNVKEMAIGEITTSLENKTVFKIDIPNKSIEITNNGAVIHLEENITGWTVNEYTGGLSVNNGFIGADNLNFIASGIQGTIANYRIIKDGVPVLHYNVDDNDTVIKDSIGTLDGSLFLGTGSWEFRKTLKPE